MRPGTAMIPLLTALLSQDATTLGVCFLTAIYSLIDLANTQRAQVNLFFLSLSLTWFAFANMS